MLTQLTTLKSRLGIDEFDVKYDTLLTNAINAISTRFDSECNRTLTRTVGTVHEFSADDPEILVPCYPVETVTKLELKENEADGWTEQTNTEFLIRRSCTISLAQRLGSWRQRSEERRVGKECRSRGWVYAEVT